MPGLLLADVALQEVMTSPSGLMAWGIGALFLAICLSMCVVSFLRWQEFDELFAPPWKPLSAQPVKRRVNASGAIGWGLFFSVLIIGAWQFGKSQPVQIPGIETALRLCQQFWSLLITFLVACVIARFVAGVILSIFQNQAIRSHLEMMFPQPKRNLPDAEAPNPESTAESNAESLNETTPQEIPLPPTESFADTLARMVGLLIYGLVFLPVLMIAAEIWGWNTTGSTVAQIWIWLLPMAGITAIITIGWFALTAFAISVCPPEQRRAVMIATTSVAVVLLVASYNPTLAILGAVAIGAICWYARKDLSDFFAGLQLQFNPRIKVRTAFGEGELTQIGMLVSRLRCEGIVYQVRNRHIHKAYLDGAEIAASHLVNTAAGGTESPT